MLNIKKILLPVDFPNASLPVIHQAATLAHLFHSEIVILHVVKTASHIADVPEDGPGRADWDVLAEIIRGAQKSQDQSLEPELDGLTIQRVSVKGDVARAIVDIAQKEKADLIMMPSHGHTFSQFLMGTATARGQDATECPVWTGAHFEGSPVRKFAIQNVLCAIDFNSHDRKTLSWAVRIAAEFGARLTIAHVTASVEFYGPGGTYVDSKWREGLVGNASEHIEKLQQEIAIKTDVFIGSGDVPKVLGQAATQTKADLLVTGSRPYGGHLRTHGYAIICAVPIPVLSV